MLKRCLAWRRCLGAAVVAAAFAGAASTAKAQYGVSQPTDWERFYHYPYVYYPTNFQPRVQFDEEALDELAESIRERGVLQPILLRPDKYPPERRIPVYRADWYNYYPNTRPYHSGHHFELDVF